MMTAKKADMCPIAYDLRHRNVAKNSKSKIYCGFYNFCERFDKGNYIECKKVDEK
ncbi:MAG: hypothetical protein QXL86_03050 [Candidatus Aenigmatarchaeota archaeon]